MFNKIKFEVTFVKPGRTIKGEYVFSEGMTAIVGPNGKGKSLILEMINFALHGTSALRGPASGYKKIAVELEFTLNEEKLAVVRDGSKVLFVGENGSIATGTKPVNAAIIQRFGYSPDVFRTANYAGQGEIERLGTMLPTARKRLVDETIGLSALDELTVFIQKEITGLASSVKTLESITVEPVAPVEDTQLASPEAYRSRLRDMYNMQAQIQRLQAIVEQTLVPVEVPDIHPEHEKILDYLAVQDKRRLLMNEASVIMRQMNVLPPVLNMAPAELHERDGEYDAIEEKVNLRRRLGLELSVLEKECEAIPLSLYTQEQLDQATAAWELSAKVLKKKELKAKNVPHDCPNCKHHWEEEDPRIATEFADVPDELPIRLDHGLSPGDVKVQQKILDQQPRKEELQDKINKMFEDRQDLEPYTVLFNDIKNKRETYYKAEKNRADAAQRAKLEAESDKISKEFEALPDYDAKIDEINKANEVRAKALVEHEKYLNAYQTQLDAKVDLELLPPNIGEQISENNQYLEKAIAYEINVKNYAEAKVKYDALKKRLDYETGLLEDWQKSKTAVTDLRAKVKGYIVPSLNMVASKLLSEMTGGELSWVSIDEDFNITVEGQALETLSGAGKGVANLALRLALGQVLTNSVFPVVLLDEIDASFDDERAAYTSACLQRLTSIFKQVIIVSHKQSVKADHFVRL